MRKIVIWIFTLTFIVLWMTPTSTWLGNEVECFDVSTEDWKLLGTWTMPARVRVGPFEKTTDVECFENSSHDMVAKMMIPENGGAKFDVCNSKANIFGYRWAYCDREKLNEKEN